MKVLYLENLFCHFLYSIHLAVPEDYLELYEGIYNSQAVKTKKFVIFEDTPVALGGVIKAMQMRGTEPFNNLMYMPTER